MKKNMIILGLGVIICLGGFILTIIGFNTAPDNSWFSILCHHLPITILLMMCGGGCLIVYGTQGLKKLSPPDFQPMPISEFIPKQKL